MFMAMIQEYPPKIFSVCQSGVKLLQLNYSSRKINLKHEKRGTGRLDKPVTVAIVVAIPCLGCPAL